MRFLKILFFTHLLSIGIAATESVYKSIVIEDFEKSESAIINLQVESNIQQKPEWKISGTFSSPDINSEKSLLVRLVSPVKEVPQDYFFKNPPEIDGYLEKLEFHIYSNNISGDLSVFIDDTQFKRHKVLISRLNFEGWKKIGLTIKNRVGQKNFIPSKSRKIKIIGFAFDPSPGGDNLKDDIFAIDDIIAIVRDKYKVPIEMEFKKWQQ